MKREELVKAWAAQKVEKESAGPNGPPLSTQARRGKGEKTGPTPASERDLASKMGVSRKTVGRRRKVAEALGTETLEEIVGTPLAKQGQMGLDAGSSSRSGTPSGRRTGRWKRRGHFLAQKRQK